MKLKILFDRTPYTWRWVKALYWCQDELKRIGDISLENDFFFYSNNEGMDYRQRIANKEYDIILIAYHPFDRRFANLPIEDKIDALQYIHKHFHTYTFYI